MNLNKILFAGNLTADPEGSTLSSGTAVSKFTLAANEEWADGSGQKQTRVTYLECTAFGLIGKTINQHCRKGKALFIEGKLRLDRWQTGEGEKRQKLYAIVESFQFVGKKESTKTA